MYFVKTDAFFAFFLFKKLLLKSKFYFEDVFRGLFAENCTTIYQYFCHAVDGHTRKEGIEIKFYMKDSWFFYYRIMHFILKKLFHNVMWLLTFTRCVVFKEMQEFGVKVKVTCGENGFSFRTFFRNKIRSCHLYISDEFPGFAMISYLLTTLSVQLISLKLI